ncbi:MAG TPA: hypothetical protein VFO27_06055 [Bryobacteraceae bacterium]|nr:hypothetical protein [Bryobacteraceae bacterium]
MDSRNERLGLRVLASAPPLLFARNMDSASARNPFRSLGFEPAAARRAGPAVRHRQAGLALGRW